jgi:hypothetical protein
MVYDAARGMIVLFGGAMRIDAWDWLEYGDTWGWDGVAGTQFD